MEALQSKGQVCSIGSPIVRRRVFAGTWLLSSPRKPLSAVLPTRRHLVQTSGCRHIPQTYHPGERSKCVTYRHFVRGRDGPPAWACITLLRHPPAQRAARQRFPDQRSLRPWRGYDWRSIKRLFPRDRVSATDVQKIEAGDHRKKLHTLGIFQRRSESVNTHPNRLTRTRRI